MITTNDILKRLTGNARAEFFRKCVTANGFAPMDNAKLADAFRKSAITNDPQHFQYKKTTAWSHSGFMRNLRPDLLAVILSIQSLPSKEGHLKGLQNLMENMTDAFGQNHFQEPYNINPQYWPLNEVYVSRQAEAFEKLINTVDVQDNIPVGLLNDYNIINWQDEPSPSAEFASTDDAEPVKSEMPATPKHASAIALNKEVLPLADQALASATGGEHTSIEKLLDWNRQLCESVDELSKIKSQVAATGDMPKGKTVQRKVTDVFPNNKSKFLPEHVTCYEWDGPNSHVPDVDPHHIFVDSDLATYLQARELKLNTWIHGDTGCGKSTFAQQVDARTGTMNERVNFDTDITRVEFVGTHAVVIEEGQQVTKFVEGILPKVMQMPATLLLDEADAIRPDIAYVLQPVLEHGSLRLLEDGGRMITPHPDFRIVSTANSAGSGDMSGLYASAVQAQSAATRNRYDVFIKMEYLPAATEVKMVREKFTITNAAATRLTDFMTKYRKAFTEGEIQEPLSPRNTHVLAQFIEKWELLVGLDLAFERAITFNLTNRVDEQQRAVIVGLGDRVTT